MTTAEHRSDTRAVIDAAAAVALLIDPGAGGERLADRLRGSDLHAPDHLPVEVANVLRRHRSRGLLSDAEATLALGGLWQLGITLWPFEVLAGRTWELGGAISAYDGAYVALAEHLGAPLFTLDARLARSSGPRCRIETP